MSKLAHSSDFMDQIERDSMERPDEPLTVQFMGCDVEVIGPSDFMVRERAAWDRLFALMRRQNEERRKRWAQSDNRIANATKEHQQ